MYISGCREKRESARKHPQVCKYSYFHCYIFSVSILCLKHLSKIVNFFHNKLVSE